MLQANFWIDIPREVARARRLASGKCTTTHFDEEMWPHHERYVQRVEDDVDRGDVALYRIDGRKERMALLCEVLAYAPCAALATRTAAAARVDAIAEEHHAATPADASALLNDFGHGAETLTEGEDARPADAAHGESPCRGRRGRHGRRGRQEGCGGRRNSHGARGLRAGGGARTA